MRGEDVVTLKWNTDQESLILFIGTFLIGLLELNDSLEAKGSW